MNRQPQPQPLPQQQQQQRLPPQPIVSNQVVLFVAIVGAGAYAVYTVGDLQSVIYAVSGAYVLRLLMRNPEIIRQLQDGLSSLQGQVQRPRLSAAQTSPPLQPVFAEGIPPTQRDPLVAPRLDMNFVEQVHPAGYQPLPTHVVPVEEFENGTPATPTPSYHQYTGGNHRANPSRAESRASNLEDFPVPARNPYGSYSHYDAGTINGERVAGTPLTAAAAPLNASRPDSRASNVSGVSDFPLPTRNPYGSYSHYDAGTIGGERVVQRVEIPDAFPTLNERIAAPPPRPESSVSMHAENFPLPAKNPYGSYSHYDAGTIGGQLVGRSSSRSSSSSHSQSPSYNPSPLRVETKVQEFVPTRQHRKPTIAARVGEVAAPGGGIAPVRASSTSPDTSAKFFNSPLVNSPSVTSPQYSGYDSDSSHASSSSSGHSHERQVMSNSHIRSESLGLPTYEKHSTTIFTLVPKRPGYVPQIQAILKAARNPWLALPGSVSHEVGQDESTGSVVVVETYETSDSMEDFEKSKERETILGRLKNFIDESKTTVVRLPGSSAATRVIR